VTPTAAILTDGQVLDEARALDKAERTRTQTSPITERFPDVTLDDAYRVQAAWKNIRLERGEKMVGHKIGLTSRAMQQAMNISTPDSGFITDAMVFESGQTITAAEHLDAKLEVELAFVLGHDLTEADHTVEDVLAATEYVIPALELIAARSWRKNPDTGRTRLVYDTISDNAANAGIVTGGQKMAPDAVDLRWVSSILSRNGVVEETGVAAGVLDHPARGIVWLAERYVQQGMKLEAGQIILSGSFTRPVDCGPGDQFVADYGPLGTIEVAFS